MQGREDGEGERDEDVAETKGDEVMARRFSLGQRVRIGEFQTGTITGRGNFYDWIVTHDDGTGYEEPCNESELALIDAPKPRNVTTIEGVVEVSGGRDGWAFVGKTHIETALEPFNEKRVRVTIEPLDDAKEVAE
jgi:hypothetical protein